MSARYNQTDFQAQWKNEGNVGKKPGNMHKPPSWNFNINDLNEKKVCVDFNRPNKYPLIMFVRKAALLSNDIFKGTF